MIGSHMVGSPGASQNLVLNGESVAGSGGAESSCKIVRAVCNAAFDAVAAWNTPTPAALISCVDDLYCRPCLVWYEW